MNDYIQLKDKNGNNIYPNSPQRIFVVTGTSGTLNMFPGYIYQAEQLDSINLILESSSNSDFNATYFISFKSGSTPTSVVWPDGLTYADRTSPPNILSNATYEIRIQNGLCSVQVYGVVNSDISNKADKVSGANDGDIASLDSDGNLVDSGYNPGDFIRSSDIITQNTRYVQLKDGVSDIIPLSMWPESSISGASITLQPDIAYFKTDTINTDTTISLDTSASVSGYETRYNMIFKYDSGTMNWPNGHWNIDMSTFVLESDTWYEIDIKIIHGETFCNICKYY